MDYIAILDLESIDNDLRYKYVFTNPLNPTPLNKSYQGRGKKRDIWSTFAVSLEQHIVAQYVTNTIVFQHSGARAIKERLYPNQGGGGRRREASSIISARSQFSVIKGAE